MLVMWVKVRVKPEERERFLKAIEVDALGSERDEGGLHALQRPSGHPGRECLLLLRGLPGRGCAGGASGGAALRRLARGRRYAGRAAPGYTLPDRLSCSCQVLGTKIKGLLSRATCCGRQIRDWSGRQCRCHRCGLVFSICGNQAPTPAKAARLRQTTIERFVKAHRLRRWQAPEVLSILKQKPLSVAPRVVEAAIDHIRTLTVRIRVG
jgi:hypothetical protein